MAATDENHQDPLASADAHDRGWKPDEAFLGQLLTGTLGASLAGLMSVIAAVWLLTQNQGFAAGFTPAQGFDLAASLAIVLTLLVLYRLGRAVGSPGLRKSSLGLMVATLAGALLGLADPAIVPPPGPIILGAAASAGIIFLVILFFIPFRDKAATEDAATTTSQTRKAGAGIGGLAFVVLALFKVVGRLLGKQVGIARLGVEEWLQIAALVAAALGLIYLVWMGVTHIRLRERLGATSAILGWFEVLLPLVVLAAVVWACSDVIAIIDQPALNEQQQEKALEELAESWLRFALTGQVVVAALWSGLMALFFLTLRGRHVPDWQNQPAGEPS